MTAPGRSPYFIGFTTLDSEVTRSVLPVRGQLPEWLTGSLVRTGPARFEVGDTEYNHWFDGLAMLHRFDFAAGRVSYTNRYLRSRAYEEAMAAGTIARGEFATDPCRMLFQRVTSWFSPKVTDNGCVNIAELADAAVALTESRLPVRFDPETLVTLGFREYDDLIQGPVSTAHPHFDHVRHCHYNYVLDFGRRSTYRFFAIDQDTGLESPVAAVQVDRPAYVHSFGMTEHYLILAEVPLVVNPLRLKFSGKPFIRNYEWEPERGVRFHILDKSTGRLVRTAEAHPFFAFHHINAFEDGGDVVVDMVTHRNPTIIDELYLNRLRSAEPVTATGRLGRFRIGARGDVAREDLSGVSIELPRFNYRGHAGRRYRYVYGAGNRITGDFLDSLIRIDLEGGTATSWHDDGCYPGEPVFVNGPGDAGEAAGVVLSVVLDTRNSRSFLLILDASTFQEIARAEAPHHIPFGFHGQFLGAS